MKLIFPAAILILGLLLTGCQADHSPPKDPTPAAARVTGIGGIFFKCKDPKAMKQWYGQHLGLVTNAYGANFEWREANDPSRKGSTQWTPFRENTKYFQPSTKEFMINYRVSNLDLLIKQFRSDGVTIIDDMQVAPYGKFLHILDPEGNAIELWEPTEAAK